MNSIWKEHSPIVLDEKVLPRRCENCSISRSRLVDFPAPPVIRQGRIIIVGEFPSYEALQKVSPNPYLGHTWNILIRALDHLKISHDDFSYSPLIRCWRNTSHTVVYSEYKTCSDWLTLFASVTEAPAIIMLGSTVIKNLMGDSCYSNGKYIGTTAIRQGWREIPYNTTIGVFGIPTEHPQSVVPERCNSQILFRSIVIDVMRAIGYSAQGSKEYKRIAQKMNAQGYMEEYMAMVEEVKNRENI